MCRRHGHTLDDRHLRVGLRRVPLSPNRLKASEPACVVCSGPEMPIHRRPRLATRAALGYTAGFITSNQACTAVFSLDHLDAIREAELDTIASFFPVGARILEIGAGTGKQALELQRRGFEVTAIEVADSNYAAHRVFPIKDYDGRTIPMADGSVDL